MRKKPYEIPRPPPELEQRRKEILAEYRFHGLEPIRIMREPVSMELALILGLLIDTREFDAARPVETIEGAK